MKKINIGKDTFCFIIMTAAAIAMSVLYFTSNQVYINDTNKLTGLLGEQKNESQILLQEREHYRGQLAQEKASRENLRKRLQEQEDNYANLTEINDNLTETNDKLFIAQRESEKLIEKIEENFLISDSSELEFGSKTVRPVLFLTDPSKLDTHQHELLAIKRVLLVTQLWFQEQIDVTFSLNDPIVVFSKHNTDYYNELETQERMRVIREEIGLPGTIAIFLRVSEDGTSWGSEELSMTLMAISFDNMDYSYRRYQLSGLISHELGHAWGLSHNNKPGTLMYGEREYISSSNPAVTFPLSTLSEEEKMILKINLTKR